MPRLSAVGISSLQAGEEVNDKTQTTLTPLPFWERREGEGQRLIS